MIQTNFLGFKSVGRSFSLDIFTQITPHEDYQDIASEFIFVDIDEKSLTDLGQWPWPRVIFADVMEKIIDAEPAVLGIDILLSETDRFNPIAIESIAKESGINIADFFTNGDKALAGVLYDAPVVLATAFGDKTKNTPKNASQILVKDKARFDLRNTPGMIFPINELENLAGYGFVNVDLDHVDHTVRYLPLLAALDGKFYPSFVLEMVRVYEEDQMLNLSEIKGTLPFNSIATGFFNLPVTENGNFILHHGYVDKFGTLSISDIINGSIDDESLTGLLEDKIVILGSSASGLNDLHSTSLEQAVPGPLIQLATIHQILSERYLKLSPEIDAATFVVLFLFLVLLCLLAGKDRVNTGLVFTSTISIILFGICTHVFNQEGYIINLFLLIAFAVAALSLTLAQSAFLVLNKRALQSAFGQYLAPEMVKAIEKSGKQPELGGEKKQISIVMTDMRNFTALGESYGEDVEGFTSTMNRYMTAIAQPVLDNQGTLLKFIGDASLHIHGAPLDDDQHAVRSITTALGMIEAVDKFNAELAREGKPPVGLGVGVNTGDTLVGNIGAKTKFGYDVLGDPVSVAARLESQTKSYGVLIIVGPDTVDHCGNNFNWWELDNIAVKGKEEPLRIYTIHKQTPEHEAFLNNYYAGKWEIIFEKIQTYKDAAPQMADYYENMIARMKMGKPNDWNGIYRATSK